MRLSEKAQAREFARILTRVTGDPTRLVNTATGFERAWKVERFTGSQWVAA